MVLNDIARLGAIAAAATREYNAKRDAAAKSLSEAEMTRGSSKPEDEYATEQRWVRAVRTRIEAGEAAAAAHRRAVELCDLSRALAAQEAAALKEAMVSGRVPDKELLRKKHASIVLTMEARRACAALVMGMIDVATERHDKIALLQKISSSAVMMNRLKGRDGISHCVKLLQEDLSRKTLETSIQRKSGARTYRHANSAPSCGWCLRPKKRTVRIVNHTRDDTGGEKCCVAM